MNNKSILFTIIFCACVDWFAPFPIRSSRVFSRSENVSRETNPPKPDELIYLNFENADLMNLVNYMADLKKINIIPDKALAGNKVTLATRRPISKDEAWRMFYTILEKAMFTIVQVGDAYKIVPKDKKNREPLTAYINVDSKDLPSSDATIRYVAFLENIKVQDVEGLLRSMLDQNAMVVLQSDINCVVVADKSYNIKKAFEVINSLDKTGLAETVETIRLQNLNATDVRDMLKGLTEDPNAANPFAQLLNKQQESSSFFTQGTKIIADERQNALILIGTKDAISKIEEFIKKIDPDLKDVKSPLHIYEVQFMDAKQLAELLKDATATPPSPVGEEAQKRGAVRGGVKYFKPLNIQADQNGNRLLVSTSDNKDWEFLNEIIKNLDKPQPMVAVETLIVLADVIDDKFLGGQFRNKKHGNFGNHVDFQSEALTNTILETTGSPPNVQNISLLGNLLNGLSGGVGTTLLTFGRKDNIWAIFQALQSMTHSTILAQPFLTIANKFESKIVIGETKRIVAQETSTGQKGFVDTDANLELTVKPQINIDGVVNLGIKIKLEEFTSPDGTQKVSRSVDTKVSVADGQIIALGGIVRTKVSEKTAKTPILGDIPILKWMFSQKQKNVEKQNVLVFMAPTILKPRTMPGINPYTQLKLSTAKDVVEGVTPTGTEKDPINNWFFGEPKGKYSHKVDDYSSARYQPVTVDMKHDKYYRAKVEDNVK